MEQRRLNSREHTCGLGETGQQLGERFGNRKPNISEMHVSERKASLNVQGSLVEFALYCSLDRMLLR